jgi:hypothetical protein
VYRHFAELLYSRSEATPIDQDIIKLLVQRPVKHLLADEPDKAELLRVLNNRKCGSAPGETASSLAITGPCVLR